MPINIETFSNTRGGNAAFKALTHPGAAERGRALAARLKGAGRLAVYDPDGLAEGYAQFFDLGPGDVAQFFVQDIAGLGRQGFGCAAQPVTELSGSGVDLVFVAAFNASRLIDHIRHLVPKDADIVSLDDMRLDPEMLANRGNYLDGMNFATNFAFFRDAGGRHTRIVTANYWAGYGAPPGSLWLMLFDEDGALLCEWRETLGDTVESIVIDSHEVRERFGLGDFTGQLFIHRVGAAGHDVVKYALDTYTEDGSEISCSHDANAWPSDRYAGLPAPSDGETVTLWVQNSHPSPIAAGEVGLNVMGSDDIAWLDNEIAPFGTCAVDVASLLPGVTWPAQIEVRAGKHFVRPRYEVTSGKGRVRIAHVNVERADLKPDPAIRELGNLMGKGFILPAPILPTDRWRSIALPTPMAEAQDELPIAAIVADASGREIARHPFGRLPRGHRTALELDPLIEEAGGLPAGYGHVELIYDFADGGDADGWLHGLFRYQDRVTGQAAETSFGAHIFNTVLTFGSEPQSYTTRAPGLSTRLFLRLGPAPLDTMCHLIYPASTPWHAESSTALILHDGKGTEVAREMVAIPCGGSRLWTYHEMFDETARERAGDRPYVVIRDTTCRLFGYHGVTAMGGAFSFDHMFGF